jgi:hypothetical protein
MAKPRPEKPAGQRVLPMNLKLGDRLADETGEYEVIGRPYTTNAGKDAARSRQTGRQGRGHDDPELGRARAYRGEARMTRRSPPSIDDAFNGRYFNGGLPRFAVRRDFKAGAPSYCDVGACRIHLPVDLVDPEETEQAVLHEMVHIVTGGAHDDAFRNEVRRIASCGEPAASRELAIEEWHVATEAAGARLAREEPTRPLRETVLRIMAAVGPHPGSPDAWPTRGFIAWQNARVLRQRDPA